MYKGLKGQGGGKARIGLAGGALKWSCRRALDSYMIRAVSIRAVSRVVRGKEEQEAECFGEEAKKGLWLKV